MDLNVISTSLKKFKSRLKTISEDTTLTLTRSKWLEGTNSHEKCINRFSSSIWFSKDLIVLEKKYEGIYLYLNQKVKQPLLDKINLKKQSFSIDLIKKNFYFTDMNSNSILEVRFETLELRRGYDVSRDTRDNCTPSTY
jgi:hypothetical protein